MQNAITTCDILLQRALIKHYILKEMFFQSARFKGKRYSVTSLINIWIQVLIRFEFNQWFRWDKSNVKQNNLIQKFETTTDIWANTFLYVLRIHFELNQWFKWDTNVLKQKNDTNEPRHDISNNVVYVTSKGSDQPVHTPSRSEPLQVSWIFYEC